MGGIRLNEHVNVIDERMTDFDDRLNALDAHINDLDQEMKKLGEHLIRVDTHINRLDDLPHNVTSMSRQFLCRQVY